MMVGGVDIRWSPKLRPEKLQRLYETDARGIVDEELIDEVGYTLYSRCDSILTVTEAFAGRLKCPGCGFVSERVEANERQLSHPRFECIGEVNACALLCLETVAGLSELETDFHVGDGVGRHH